LEGDRVPRKLLLIASVVAVVAVLFVLVVAPTLYHSGGPERSSPTSVLPTDQCGKADPTKKYPLTLEIWNSAGEPVRQGWIILHDPDRGIPFEEGYSSENGMYRTKHSYLPLQDMTLIINDFVIYENYVVTILIPDIVCADGYIHVQVKTT